jgi:hypothetical protein
MAGPVYHFDPELDSPVKLPAYYDDTLFIYEWSRNWIREVKLDANGDILKINPFAADIPLKRPMDMELGPDGALYILEWGSDFGGNNADAQLVRIEFRGTPPIVSADFDDNGVLDGADFLRWQRGLGIPGGAMRGDGDANVDGRVDAVDLDVWKEGFANAAGLSANVNGHVETAAIDAAMSQAANQGRQQPTPSRPLTTLGPSTASPPSHPGPGPALGPEGAFDGNSPAAARRQGESLPRRTAFGASPSPSGQLHIDGRWYALAAATRDEVFEASADDQGVSHKGANERSADGDVGDIRSILADAVDSHLSELE